MGKRSAWALSCLACGLTLVLGCGADEGALPTGPPWVYGASKSAADSLAGDRLACAFGAGQLASATVGVVPKGIEKLEHIVVLMMENRSFDHYFSDLPNSGVVDVDVATNQSNPTGCGTELARYHETRFCVKSPGHEWNDSHVQYAAGRMDGFVVASNPGGGRAMGYYVEEDLPFFYFLANSFAISDRHFGSVLGPTQTNRLFLWLGTSCDTAEGFVTNPAVISNCGLKKRSVFDQLDHANKTYGVYDHSGIMTLIVGLGVHPTIPKSIQQFDADAKAGKLPAVSFVGASTGEAIAPDGNDDHPPFNPQLGQAFVASIVRSIASPATWKNTALIITYDEHGGYYDHVEPPHACVPDHDTPKRDYQFDQYGFRVPLIVVSPFASSKQRVSHVDTDHTSILRFIQLWAKEPALTQRDANAWPLLDLFDFEQTPLPPPTWPENMTDVTPAAQAQCDAAPEAGDTGVPGGSQNCTKTP